MGFLESLLGAGGTVACLALEGKSQAVSTRAWELCQPLGLWGALLLLKGIAGGVFAVPKGKRPRLDRDQPGKDRGRVPVNARPRL